MLSDQKIAANRQNATLSSGPRTSEGKAVVARNACKHNLSSINVAIEGEDLADFQALLRETTVDLVPRSSVENALVQQIAFAEWKLLRIARWETQLIDATLAVRVAPCQALFGKTPDEALTRLHRYEAQIRRAWHNALKELRQQQKARAAQPVSIPSVAEALSNMMKIKDISAETENNKTNPNTSVQPASPTLIR